LHLFVKFDANSSNHCLDIEFHSLTKSPSSADLHCYKFKLSSVLIGVQSRPLRINAKIHWFLKRLQRYGDLLTFKMAAVRHLEFVVCILTWDSSVVVFSVVATQLEWAV